MDGQVVVICPNEFIDIFDSLEEANDYVEAMLKNPEDAIFYRLGEKLQ